MNSFCKLILKFISWINFRIFILTKGKTFSPTPSSLGDGQLPMSSAHNPPNATAPWRGNKLLFFLNFKSPQWNKRLPPAKISSIKAFKRLPPPRFSSYNWVLSYHILLFTCYKLFEVEKQYFPNYLLTSKIF